MKGPDETFHVSTAAPQSSEKGSGERKDDCHVLVTFVFVSAMMESVAARFVAMTALPIGPAVLAFVVGLAALCLTVFPLASTGRKDALTLVLTASRRDTGLMLAATAAAFPDLSWLDLVFTYVPLYLLPLLLQPLARRIMTARAQTTPVPPPRPT